MKMIAHRFQASVAGLSAESIVVIVAAGLVLGVFPVYGCPTLLCMLAALVFRINLPAIQLVNQVCSPLQLALWIPLNRMGALILGGSAGWDLTDAVRAAVVGWFCVCVPLGLVLYWVLAFALRRARQGQMGWIRTVSVRLGQNFLQQARNLIDSKIAHRSRALTEA